jgi:hypothetical protein
MDALVRLSHVLCCGSQSFFYADPDPNFHVDADPDPDPDWHQNNADPNPSFKYSKIRIFLLSVTALPVYNVVSSHQCQRCHNIQCFGQHIEIFEVFSYACH